MSRQSHASHARTEQLTFHTPNVTRLALHTKVAGACAASVSLAKYTRLKELSLNGHIAVVDIGLLGQLRELDLESQSCRQSLNGLSNLTSLVLSRYTEPDDIYALESLEALNLDCYDIGRRLHGPVNFSKLSRLKALTYPDTDFADSDLLSLPHLTRLCLIETDEVTNRALTTLSKLVHLELLDCEGITIDVIDGLPALRHLAVSTLYASCWPAALTNLDTLIVSGCPIVISENLSRLTGLSTLDIEHMQGNFNLISTNLTALSLRMGTSEAADLSNIHRLDHLVSLTLDCARNNYNIEFQRLLATRSLRNIQLESALITAKIADIPSQLFLQELSLCYSPIEKKLLRCLTSLKHLRITGSVITDSHIQPLSNLQTLNICDADASELSLSGLLALPFLVQLDDRGRTNNEDPHLNGLRSALQSRTLKHAF